MKVCEWISQTFQAFSFGEFVIQILSKKKKMEFFESWNFNNNQILKQTYWKSVKFLSVQYVCMCLCMRQANIKADAILAVFRLCCSKHLIAASLYVHMYIIRI